MRGHIVKRGKDSYSIVLSLGADPVTGKRKRQWVSVKGDSKTAQKRLTELLRQLDTGTFVKPDKTSLGDYFERWLEDYARANLSPRTAQGYAQIFHTYAIPALGHLTLTQLRPQHLQNYYSERLNDGLSAMTVMHHAMVIHKALQTAVKWGLLNHNLADAVELPRPKRTEMQIWDEHEMATFLEAAQPHPLYPLFYISLFTGMRRSEVLGLRWSDVDLMLGQVSVNRALHVLKGGQVFFSSPKTAKGRRTIALPPSATLLLKRHWEKQVSERLLVGSRVASDSPVFSDINGDPLRPDTVTHAWTKLVRQTGLKYIRLHDARHTHASLLLKQGVHPKVAQERLGHATISTTLDIYSHVAPGMQEAAAVRFDEALATVYNNERGKGAD
ncbi:MAG: site-specific integrase [Chloroflexi bacterium]|nr:site-specific integrase [Chloroflexota bacterium]